MTRPSLLTVLLLPSAILLTIFGYALELGWRWWLVAIVAFLLVLGCGV